MPTQEWDDERCDALREQAATKYDGREDGDPPDTDERWERWLVRAAVAEARREHLCIDPKHPDCVVLLRSALNFLIHVKQEEARRETLEFLTHAENDGVIQEFPGVRESLAAMIEQREAQARREQREAMRGFARAVQSLLADPDARSDADIATMKEQAAAILAQGERHE